MAHNEMNTVQSLEEEVRSTEPTTSVMEAQDNQINTEPLRNASPLPDSDNESEKETEKEEEEVRPAPVNKFPLALPSLLAVQGFGLQALLWIQFVWTLLSYVGSKATVVSKAVARSLQTKMYVFFQGSNYPYRLQDFTLAGPGVAPVEWFYNADAKVFLDSRLYNTTQEVETHHFDWLSGEIRYNDLSLYDITDFLEDINWGGAQKPSPSRVLAAWSLHSGIVLNGKEGLVLHTINQDGSESSLPITA